MSDQELVSKGDDEEDPFDIWCETVGFRSGFPRLKPLVLPAPVRAGRTEIPTTDSPKFFLTELHQNQVEEISQSLGNAAIAIVTAPGHGATTLARYLFQYAAEQSIIRRAIPVWVSIGDLVGTTSYEQMLEAEYAAIAAAHKDCRDRGAATRVGDEYDEEKRDNLRFEADKRARAVFGKVTVKAVQVEIQSAVRLGIIRSLVTRPWERVLQKAFYRDLLGAKVATPNEFAARRAELAAVLENSGLEALARLAPRLTVERYEDLIASLNRSRSVRISLFLDLSATPLGRFYIDDKVGEYLTRPYLTVVQHFTKAVKNIEQAGAIGPQPTLPSLLDKTYFLSRDAWSSFEATFAEQEGERVDYQPYRSIDAFAMLAHHYPFTAYQWEHHRTELLAAVLDSEYIQLDRRTALSTQMAMLECEVRADLPDRGGSVSYHIRKGGAERRLSSEEFETLRQITEKMPVLSKLLTDLEEIAADPREEASA